MKRNMRVCKKCKRYDIYYSRGKLIWECGMLLDICSPEEFVEQELTFGNDRVCLFQLEQEVLNQKSYTLP